MRLRIAKNRGLCPHVKNHPLGGWMFISLPVPVLHYILLAMHEPGTDSDHECTTEILADSPLGTVIGGLTRTEKLAKRAPARASATRVLFLIELCSDETMKRISVVLLAESMRGGSRLICVRSVNFDGLLFRTCTKSIKQI